ncbi:uncharacterized protein LOC132168438 isoform X2 [Corylus avellana]|uniref:uncharacterized protein LOC132168438 isoform X2 n=1 Tax=Corylus avellana TaxID=13451 RepID=UPI002869FAC1|nr:uncharacterized protein LOC132168438 isoform X2 [Corylus avellana]
MLFGFRGLGKNQLSHRCSWKYGNYQMWSSIKDGQAGTSMNELHECGGPSSKRQSTKAGGSNYGLDIWKDKFAISQQQQL